MKLLSKGKVFLWGSSLLLALPILTQAATDSSGIFTVNATVQPNYSLVCGGATTPCSNTTLNMNSGSAFDPYSNSYYATLAGATILTNVAGGLNYQASDTGNGGNGTTSAISCGSVDGSTTCFAMKGAISGNTDVLPLKVEYEPCGTSTFTIAVPGVENPLTNAAATTTAPGKCTAVTQTVTPTYTTTAPAAATNGYGTLFFEIPQQPSSTPITADTYSDKITILMCATGAACQ